MKDIRQAVLKASAALKVLSEVVTELGTFAADALDTMDTFAGEVPTDATPSERPPRIPESVAVTQQTATDSPAATTGPSIAQCQQPQCGTVLNGATVCPRCGVPTSQGAR